MTAEVFAKMLAVRQRLMRLDSGSLEQGVLRSQLREFYIDRLMRKLRICRQISQMPYNTVGARRYYLLQARGVHLGYLCLHTIQSPVCAICDLAGDLSCRALVLGAIGLQLALP